MKAGAKADAAFRFLYPFLHRGSPLSSAAKAHIYRTYILPLLMYAVSLTMKLCQSRMKVLERKQNKNLRTILDIKWYHFITNSKLLEIAKIDRVEAATSKIYEKFKTGCRESDNALNVKLVRQ